MAGTNNPGELSKHINKARSDQRQHRHENTAIYYGFLSEDDLNRVILEGEFVIPSDWHKRNAGQRSTTSLAIDHARKVSEKRVEIARQAAVEAANGAVDTNDNAIPANRVSNDKRTEAVDLMVAILRAEQKSKDPQDTNEAEAQKKRVLAAIKEQLGEGELADDIGYAVMAQSVNSSDRAKEAAKQLLVHKYKVSKQDAGDIANAAVGNPANVPANHHNKLQKNISKAAYACEGGAASAAVTARLAVTAADANDFSSKVDALIPQSHGDKVLVKAAQAAKDEYGRQSAVQGTTPQKNAAAAASAFAHVTEFGAVAKAAGDNLNRDNVINQAVTGIAANANPTGFAAKGGVQAAADVAANAVGIETKRAEIAVVNYNADPDAARGVQDQANVLDGADKDAIRDAVAAEPDNAKKADVAANTYLARKPAGAYIAAANTQALAPAAAGQDCNLVTVAVSQEVKDLLHDIFNPERAELKTTVAYDQFMASVRENPDFDTWYTKVIEPPKGTTLPEKQCEELENAVRNSLQADIARLRDAHSDKIKSIEAGIRKNTPTGGDPAKQVNLNLLEAMKRQLEEQSQRELATAIAFIDTLPEKLAKERIQAQENAGKNYFRQHFRHFEGYDGDSSNPAVDVPQNPDDHPVINTGRSENVTFFTGVKRYINRADSKDSGLLSKDPVKSSAERAKGKKAEKPNSRRAVISNRLGFSDSFDTANLAENAQDKAFKDGGKVQVLFPRKNGASFWQSDSEEPDYVIVIRDASSKDSKLTQIEAEVIVNPNLPFYRNKDDLYDKGMKEANEYIQIMLKGKNSPMAGKNATLVPDKGLDEKEIKRLQTVIDTGIKGIKPAQPPEQTNASAEVLTGMSEKEFARRQLSVQTDTVTAQFLLTESTLLSAKVGNDPVSREERSAIIESLKTLGRTLDVNNPDEQQYHNKVTTLIRDLTQDPPVATYKQFKSALRALAPTYSDPQNRIDNAVLFPTEGQLTPKQNARWKAFESFSRTIQKTVYEGKPLSDFAIMQPPRAMKKEISSSVISREQSQEQTRTRLARSETMTTSERLTEFEKAFKMKQPNGEDLLHFNENWKTFFKLHAGDPKGDRAERLQNPVSRLLVDVANDPGRQAMLKDMSSIFKKGDTTAYIPHKAAYLEAWSHEPEHTVLLHHVFKMWLENPGELDKAYFEGLTNGGYGDLKTHFVQYIAEHPEQYKHFKQLGFAAELESDLIDILANDQDLRHRWLAQSGDQAFGNNADEDAEFRAKLITKAVKELKVGGADANAEQKIAQMQSDFLHVYFGKQSDGANTGARRKAVKEIVLEDANLNRIHADLSTHDHAQRLKQALGDHTNVQEANGVGNDELVKDIRECAVGVGNNERIDEYFNQYQTAHAAVEPVLEQAETYRTGGLDAAIQTANAANAANAAGGARALDNAATDKTNAEKLITDADELLGKLDGFDPRIANTLNDVKTAATAALNCNGDNLNAAQAAITAGQTALGHAQAAYHAQRSLFIIQGAFPHIGWTKAELPVLAERLNGHNALQGNGVDIAPAGQDDNEVGGVRHCLLKLATPHEAAVLIAHGHGGNWRNEVERLGDFENAVNDADPDEVKAKRLADIYVEMDNYNKTNPAAGAINVRTWNAINDHMHTDEHCRKALLNHSDLDKQARENFVERYVTQNNNNFVDLTNIVNEIDLVPGVQANDPAACHNQAVVLANFDCTRLAAQPDEAALHAINPAALKSALLAMTKADLFNGNVDALYKQNIDHCAKILFEAAVVGNDPAQANYDLNAPDRTNAINELAKSLEKISDRSKCDAICAQLKALTNVAGGRYNNANAKAMIVQAISKFYADNPERAPVSATATGPLSGSDQAALIDRLNDSNIAIEVKLVALFEPLNTNNTKCYPVNDEGTIIFTERAAYSRFKHPREMQFNLLSRNSITVLKEVIQNLKTGDDTQKQHAAQMMVKLYRAYPDEFVNRVARFALLPIGAAPVLSQSQVNNLPKSDSLRSTMITQMMQNEDLAKAFFSELEDSDLQNTIGSENFGNVERIFERVITHKIEGANNQPVERIAKEQKDFFCDAVNQSYDPDKNYKVYSALLASLDSDVLEEIADLTNPDLKVYYPNAEPDKYNNLRNFFKDVAREGLSNVSQGKSLTSVQKHAMAALSGAELQAVIENEAIKNPDPAGVPYAPDSQNAFENRARLLKELPAAQVRKVLYAGDDATRDRYARTVMQHSPALRSRGDIFNLSQSQTGVSNEQQNDVGYARQFARLVENSANHPKQIAYLVDVYFHLPDNVRALVLANDKLLLPKAANNATDLQQKYSALRQGILKHTKVAPVRKADSELAQSGTSLGRAAAGGLNNFVKTEDERKASLREHKIALLNKGEDAMNALVSDKNPAAGLSDDQKKTALKTSFDQLASTPDSHQVEVLSAVLTHNSGAHDNVQVAARNYLQSKNAGFWETNDPHKSVRQGVLTKLADNGESDNARSLLLAGDPQNSPKVLCDDIMSMSKYIMARDGSGITMYFTELLDSCFQSDRVKQPGNGTQRAELAARLINEVHAKTGGKINLWKNHFEGNAGTGNYPAEAAIENALSRISPTSSLENPSFEGRMSSGLGG